MSNVNTPQERIEYTITKLNDALEGREIDYVAAKGINRLTTALREALDQLTDFEGGFIIASILEGKALEILKAPEIGIEPRTSES